MAPVESVVLRTDKRFTDGLCSGYLCYFHDYQGKTLTDGDILAIVQDTLKDERYFKLFLAGWLVSFIEALLEDRDVFAR